MQCSILIRMYPLVYNTDFLRARKIKIQKTERETQLLFSTNKRLVIF